MGDSEELASKERRRKLIERLNEKEKLLGPNTQAKDGQMSEGELAAEIEKERQRNLSRQGFPLHRHGRWLSGPSSRAWKDNSANFRFTEFCELRKTLGVATTALGIFKGSREHHPYEDQETGLEHEHEGGPDPVSAGDVPHRVSIRGGRHRLTGGRVK
jgi:hypothetical protein